MEEEQFAILFQKLDEILEVLKELRELKYD